MRLAFIFLAIGLQAWGAWGYRRTVTIDHTQVPNSDQANFPVLVSGTYSYLATVANGGKVTSGSGYDIIFTSDSACAVKLDHEIESYAPTTGAVNLWFRVASLSYTADTVVYLCYGDAAVTTSQENKTGVWNANFVGVWHLREDPSGSAPQMLDSTSLVHHGTSGGGMLTGDQVAGRVDGSLDFDGSDDGIYVPSFTQLNGTNLSISAWINPTNFTSGGGVPRIIDRSYNGQFVLYFQNSGELSLAVGTTGTSLPYPTHMCDAGAVVTGQWQLVAATYDGETAVVYVNGVACGTSTTPSGPLATSTSQITIGTRPDASGRWFTGGIDEVRLLSAGLSGDWIVAEYNNQKASSTFWAIGNEVALGGAVSRRRVIE